MQLAAAQEKLRVAGVGTVAIVNTPAERARQYFRYRPTPLLLAADAELATHRAFGLPKVAVTLGDVGRQISQGPPAATLDEPGAGRTNRTGESPPATDPNDTMRLIDRKKGSELSRVDAQVVVAHGSQLAGHFLIDQQGIVRWAHVETQERLAKFPSEAELLAAARTLPH